MGARAPISTQPCTTLSAALRNKQCVCESPSWRLHVCSTPASEQPAKFKLALAAPVGQRLKPELISTLKTLGIGRRLPRRRSCRGGARKVRAISVAGPSSVRSRDLSGFHLPPCLLPFATTFLAPPPPPPPPLLRLAATRTI